MAHAAVSQESHAVSIGARVCVGRFVRHVFIPRRKRGSCSEPCAKEGQWLVHAEFARLPGTRVAPHTAWRAPCHRVARARDEQTATVAWRSVNSTCLETHRLTLDHVDDAPLATHAGRRRGARRRRARNRSVRLLWTVCNRHEGIGRACGDHVRRRRARRSQWVWQGLARGGRGGRVLAGPVRRTRAFETATWRGLIAAGPCTALRRMGS